MPGGASLLEPVRAEMEALGLRGSGCLLRRRGASLVPEPLPDGPPPPAVEIPLGTVFRRGTRASGGRSLLLSDPSDLEPLRDLIDDEATCAVITPVPPPAPRGGHELYLLVWFEPGERPLAPAGPLVRAMAGDVARAIGRERTRAEGLESEENGLLRAALESCSHGAILMEPDGSVRWVNHEGSQVTGPAHPLEAGTNVFQVLTPASAERVRRLAQAAASGAIASEEIDLAVEESDRRPCHLTVDAVHAPEGEFFLLSFRKLSDRDRLIDVLRREKNFTRSLLEAANSCVLGLDVQGRTILFNKVFQELSGYKLGDVLGLDALQILVPGTGQSRWRDAHLGALSGTPVEDQDFLLKTRSGEERLLCLSAGRINDAAGVCRGVLWTGRDVTLERRRERELRVQEEATHRSLSQLKEFSRISSMILQEKDLDSVCKMFVNAISEVSSFRRAILTLCDEDFRGYMWYFAGLSEEEIATFHRNKMTQRERVTIFQERFRLGNSYYIPHSEGWDYEGVRSCADTGKMVDWHPDDFLFIPLYGTNRRMVGVVSVDDPEDGRIPTAESLSPLELFANQVAHSIEEKKLDQEVKQTTERYRTLVETMYEGVFTVDLRERILLANAALGRLVGVAAPLINGRPLGSIMEPEDLAQFRTETALHDKGRVARFEMRLRSESGELIPVQVSASPYREEGILRGCFAVVRDLREQKKAEAERKAMQEQLAQAEKLSALGELISGIAHELNNPLTGVMGYSQLLLSSQASATKETMEKIHREAVRCQKIVQNLLAFARRRAPERTMTDVNALVESTLDLRAYQLKVDGVEVSTDLDPNLPPTLGDFHQLQQVFVNIINNAHHAMIEAGQPGKLSISTRHSDGAIRVTFADTGPGIPEDRIQRIFDPFYTTKEIGKGTGLGLSLSYGIVREHEGRIEVRSRPGEGACFTVVLPVREADSDSGDLAGREAEEGPVEAKHILVVDDEDTILDLLESVLESSGHRVETACNGREALEKIRNSDYDIIISDLKMPGMGGQKLYDCVSEIKPHLKRRVIFSTGDTVNPVTQELFRRTGNLHLAKPFRLEEVEEIIRRVLERAEEEGGSPSP